MGALFNRRERCCRPLGGWCIPGAVVLAIIGRVRVNSKGCQERENVQYVGPTDDG